MQSDSALEDDDDDDDDGDDDDDDDDTAGYTRTYQNTRCAEITHAASTVTEHQSSHSTHQTAAAAAAATAAAEVGNGSSSSSQNHDRNSTDQADDDDERDEASADYLWSWKYEEYAQHMEDRLTNGKRGGRVCRSTRHNNHLRRFDKAQVRANRRAMKHNVQCTRYEKKTAATRECKLAHPHKGLPAPGASTAYTPFGYNPNAGLVSGIAHGWADAAHQRDWVDVIPYNGGVVEPVQQVQERTRREQERTAAAAAAAAARTQQAAITRSTIPPK